jgi:pimeloyl-ACP methyl ester carboxylesterase
MKPIDTLSRAGVPLRITEPWTRPDRAKAPAVLFFPGLSANKEVQDGEARSLMENGFAAVVVDAPHHGARRSSLLDEMASASGDQAHHILLRLIGEAIAEIPALVDELLARGHRTVAIGGISMGAFIALGAAVEEPRLSAIVSILGSPDFAPRSGNVPDNLRERVARSPIHQLARFPPRPVLLLNGGRDDRVPPDPARRFHEALRPLYGDRETAVHYREYPESGHFVREDDWRDLWQCVLSFLHAHL